MEQTILEQQQTEDPKLVTRRERDKLRKRSLRAKQKEQLQAAKESTKERWQRLTGHLQQELPELYQELLADHELVEGLAIEAEMIQEMLADSALYPQITPGLLRAMVEGTFSELLDCAKTRGVRRFSRRRQEIDSPVNVSIRELLHAAPGKAPGSDDRLRSIDGEPELSLAEQAYRLFGLCVQPEETTLVASANALIRYANTHEVDPALLEQAKRHSLFTPQYREIREFF